MQKAVPSTLLFLAFGAGLLLATASDSAAIAKAAISTRACEKLTRLELLDSHVTRAQLITKPTRFSAAGENQNPYRRDNQRVRELDGKRRVQPIEPVEMEVEIALYVEVTTTPAPGADIRSDVWLPVREHWNGKFLSSRNSGAAGQFSYLARGVARAFAVAYTVVGTLSVVGSDPFRLGEVKPERQKNYVRGGVHYTTIVEEEVVPTRSVAVHRPPGSS